jgi:hypothetical protein
VGRGAEAVASIDSRAFALLEIGGAGRQSVEVDGGPPRPALHAVLRFVVSDRLEERWCLPSKAARRHVPSIGC